jgi:hypothetical protein
MWAEEEDRKGMVAEGKKEGSEGTERGNCGERSGLDGKGAKEGVGI